MRLPTITQRLHAHLARTTSVARSSRLIAGTARANPIDNFRLVFNDAFIKSIVGRMDDNEDIFRKILDEPEFRAVVMDHYLQRVFGRARADPSSIGTDTSAQA